MDQGVGRAHRFTKEPKPWEPTTDLVEGGGVSSDPQLLLAGLGTQWAEIWRAGTVRGGLLRRIFLFRRTVVGVPPLTRLHLQSSGLFSRAYKAKSATSLDGFHMRHYPMRCDDALVTLGILFQRMESHGFLLDTHLRNCIMRLWHSWRSFKEAIGP